jgi:integrative and conjugative element protein (TIGR02256 family)
VLSDLTFQINPNALLVIPVTLVSDLEQYRQLCVTDPEVGGAIIGIYRPPHIEITSFTRPDRQDKRSRFEFIRRSSKHLLTVLQHWKKSNGIETYLGEWHTHPEDHPTPSGTDMNEWCTKLPQGKEKLLIIIGRKSNWYGLWGGNQVNEIRPIA